MTARLPVIGLFFLLLLCAGGAELSAAVKLPAVFSSNMVLQRGCPVPVWGEAAPGESVVVEFAGQRKETLAGADGKWRIDLDAMPANSTGQVLTVVSANPKSKIQNQTFADVLVGEVWLCSGQSNMQMPVGRDANFGGVLNWEREVQEANHPGLRFFDGKKWNVCSPQTVHAAYAAAYFFGRDLHRELDIPVGLLEAAVGGSPIDAWVSPAVWTDDLKRRCIEAYRPEYAVRMEEHTKALASWEQAAKEASEKGSPAPKKPSPPGSPEEIPARASALYKRLIHPLVPYAMRGVFWYQGETNAWRIEPYRDLLTLLISGWREQWHAPDMPFLIVQLANWGQSEKYTRAAGRWADLRAMQADVARNTPHCSLIVTIDIGDTVDLHPPNKQEVGRRAALTAQKDVYGKEVSATGPEPADVEWMPGGARITFGGIGTALRLEGPEGGFELAGDDGRFFPAQARVDGPDVVLTASEIKALPRQVRYAWKDDPTRLLYNSANLPAAPFSRQRK